MTAFNINLELIVHLFDLLLKALYSLLYNPSHCIQYQSDSSDSALIVHIFNSLGSILAMQAPLQRRTHAKSSDGYNDCILDSHYTPGLRAAMWIKCLAGIGVREEFRSGWGWGGGEAELSSSNIFSIVCLKIITSGFARIFFTRFFARNS